MNSINLIGNICNDLELKQTNSGKSVISFNLAVKRPFTKDTTDFIPVVAYDKTAEYLGNYGKKGNRIALTGKLTTRKWEDKSGNKRTAYEVVADNAEILDYKNEEKNADAPTQAYVPEIYGGTNAPQFEEVPNDGDLPF